MKHFLELHLLHLLLNIQRLERRDQYTSFENYTQLKMTLKLRHRKSVAIDKWKDAVCN
jgi:hypothetical protein